MKLFDLDNTQHQGAKPKYKYHIIDVLENYELNGNYNGHFYTEFGDIPSMYKVKEVYHLEPELLDNGRLCLRIVIV